MFCRTEKGDGKQAPFAWCVFNERCERALIARQKRISNLLPEIDSLGPSSKCGRDCALMIPIFQDAVDKRGNDCPRQFFTRQCSGGVADQRFVHCIFMTCTLGCDHRRQPDEL